MGDLRSPVGASGVPGGSRASVLGIRLGGELRASIGKYGAPGGWASSEGASGDPGTTPKESVTRG